LHNKSHSQRLTVFFLLAFFSCAAFFPMRASAFSIGGLVGAAINSATQQASVNKWLNYYDKEGREELFAVFKDAYTAKENPELNILLGNIVERLSIPIAQKDISIIERPYNYFVAADKDFNAACGLGHTMMVNEGVFTFLNNDEDQIAAVVAHEMVHGQQDHNVKGVKKQMSAIFARNVIGSQVGTYGGLFLLDLVAANAINAGITKPNEWEADNLSFGFLAEAGYNPGAPAALWQRITDSAQMKENQKRLRFVLVVSTHPGSGARRDNFSKKLTEYSGNVVAVNKENGEISVHGKAFLIPADDGEVKSIERAYMIAGRLAAVYHAGPAGEAKAQDGSLFFGETFLLKAGEKDPAAEELAILLNTIK
jgi:predicted Zn-dependent protease